MTDQKRATQRMPWDITPEMFLADHEVNALLTHVRSRAGGADGRAGDSARLDQVIIEALLYSGLRTSEFCQLQVGDTGARGGASVFEVRTAKKLSRRVHVPRSLTCLVRDFITQARPAFLPEDVSPEDPGQPLIFGEHHRPFQRSGLYRRVKRILTQAGLGDRASVQLLRHTYGYLAYKNTGGNLIFVQRQLGHAHPIITSVYARLVPESYETMADTVSTGRPPHATASVCASSECEPPPGATAL